VLPNSELERSDISGRYGVLDISADGAFDELTFLAAQTCSTPIAAVAIAGQDRFWFKSKFGIFLEEIREGFNLCTQTLLQRDLFTVSDALNDDRFSGDLLVQAEPKVRFFAGMPLVGPDGLAAGSLCVMDCVPRTLTADQTRALTILGRQCSRLIAIEPPETDTLATANPLENDLLQQLTPALDQNELTIHFQPKIDLQSKKATGFEALVRWFHPNLGFIMPDQFIPLAEASGQIAVLTPWVLEETILRAHAGKWPDRGLQVAVNLSARNLHETGLPERIERILNKHGFPPASLLLEITESAVMSDFAGALDVLQRLRDIGVSLAVDDFGTGYSSLAYLKELPLQELKIDRALVTNVHRCDRDFAIVKFAVDLAHNLGMNVVGEGVEQAATLRTLTEIGCDEAQGFAIGKPMRLIDTAAWLRKH
jgi:EAL domain-containing protein (putative c-di-GMP-specific phosphodiesterase class I)